jgi:hypothetical protein
MLTPEPDTKLTLINSKGRIVAYAFPCRVEAFASDFNYRLENGAGCGCDKECLFKAFAYVWLDATSCNASGPLAAEWVEYMKTKLRDTKRFPVVILERKEQSANTEERKVKIVAQFGPEYSFVSDSQDTAPIKESVPDAKNYDAFFVLSGDGEYTAVWGMVGIVPYRSKLVTRLL